MNQRLFLVGLLSFTGGFTSLMHAEEWTKFQCGIAGKIDAAAVPLTWSESENLRWKVEIPGYGQSSPVTWDGHVYVTSISGPKKETCHVSAFDIQSGGKLWTRDFKAASEAENNNYISRAAPSPTVDAQGVYVFFEGGNLLALTHAGEDRWSRDLVAEFGAVESRHGLAASLEQTDDRLFVWVERQAEPYVLAVEKASGKDLWKVPGIGATSWASPRLIAVDGQQHLVLSAVGSVTGLDPATGQELWKLTGLKSNSTPTPMPAGDGRFLIGATQGRGEGDSGKAAESNGLVAIHKTAEGAYQADFVWRSKRSTSSFGSPLAHGGKAYFVNSTGVVFCHELETGDELYSSRLADSSWATPLGIGERVYFFGKGGAVAVLSAGNELEKLAENATWEATAPAAAETGQRPQFGGPVLYAAAYASERLLLRRGDTLYCVAVSQK